MITPYLPFPLFSGGQIRTYNLLKNLSDKHQITLVSFYRKKSELKHISELEKYCAKVVPIKRRQTWGAKNILLSGFSFYPFLVCTYLSAGARRWIKKELQNGEYDLIHVETFYLMPNLPSKTQVPILLVEQTIEYLVYQRFVQNLKFWLAKPLLYLDVLKIKFWEKRFWRQANYLSAMSQEDLDIMLSAAPQKEGDVVANGVDLEYFNQVPHKGGKKPTVLFVGNFKWLPNKDAVVYLIEKVWPKIKNKMPEAKLWVVGRNPTESILKYNQKDDVSIDSGVEDIRQAFSQSDVLLAPIRNGRGTKYKVLEAMAAQVPVVTTPLGVQGITASPGKEVLVADSAQKLAQKTLKLLKTPKKGQALAKRAKKMINDQYNWQAISQNLDKIYQKLGARR